MHFLLYPVRIFFHSQQQRHWTNVHRRCYRTFILFSEMVPGHWVGKSSKSNICTVRQYLNCLDQNIGKPDELKLHCSVFYTSTKLVFDIILVFSLLNIICFTGNILCLGGCVSTMGRASTAITTDFFSITV